MATARMKVRGAVIAMDRILFRNWSNEVAIDEMLNGGSGFAGIYATIGRYVQTYEVAKIREQVYPS